jgi:hypothetical protein
MRFLRIYTRKDTGEIVTVIERESPFTENHPPITMRTDDGTAPFEIEEHEAVAEDFDPGLAEYGPTKLLRPMTPARHLFERLHHKGGGKFDAKPGTDIPSLIDFPASMEKIKTALRSKGPNGMPVKVRAWLANILPPAHVSQLGIARGLPISAMRAAEALRNRRDPAGGSRMEYLNAIAQEQSDARAARELRRRNAKDKKAAPADEPNVYQQLADVVRQLPHAAREDKSLDPPPTT